MKLPLFNIDQYLKMSNHYQQGFYKPRNPQKYRGDPTQIFMRSSWERRFSTWADMNPNVVAWGSETVIIPYISPVDGRPHRYFVDFWIKIRNRQGETKTYLIEIKPDAQTRPPVYSKRGRKPKPERVLEENRTYAVNQAKWKYAKDYAKKRGWEFIVLTEKELAIK